MVFQGQIVDMPVFINAHLIHELICKPSEEGVKGLSAQELCMGFPYECSRSQGDAYSKLLPVSNIEDRNVRLASGLPPS